MPSVPKFPLSTSIALPSSYTIPLIGYGVYQIPSASCPALVSHALSLGYRHIDSARAYRNEKGCAEGIQRLLSDGLKREEVFFTSKLPPKNLGYESARRSVEETLEETGLGYLDLCLIHAPYGGKRARLGAWRGLCEMWKEGKVRSIGISNYGLHHLQELQSYRVASTSSSSSSPHSLASSTNSSPAPDPSDTPLLPPDCNPPISVAQYELHPWLPHHDLISFCRSQSPPIAIQAWSPLVRGTRANAPILTSILEKLNGDSTDSIAGNNRNDDDKFNEKTNLEKRNRKGRTWAQVLIRWNLLQGFIPLPKTESLERMEENLGAMDLGEGRNWEEWEDEVVLAGFERGIPEGVYEPCSWDPTVSRD